MSDNAKAQPSRFEPSPLQNTHIDKFSEIKTVYIVQFQINDPGYKYRGEWFDKFERDSLEAGQSMLETARTRYADSASAYRLVMRTKVRAETTTVLPD